VGFGQYILDEDGNPRLVHSVREWAEWFEHSHQSKGKDCRILQQDHIGKVFISTVFLGLDHNYYDDGPPVLWETMIFHDMPESALDQYMQRYCTRDEAIIGHMKAVELVKQSDKDLQELERMFALHKWEKRQ
jgi:hypothetical protein